MLETAFGIKLSSHLLCCRKLILRAIESYDRHRVPQIRRIARREAIGELDGSLQDLSEKGPTNLCSSLGQAASMDLIGFGPQTASPGGLEEFTRFDVHSLALSAPQKREDKHNELGKGKLTSAGKIVGGSFDFGGNLFRDKV